MTETTDTSTKRAEDSLPWNTPALKEWSIVGMNHYFKEGKRHLFVAMVLGPFAIKAEGTNEVNVWSDLTNQAEALAKFRDTMVSHSQQTAKVAGMLGDVMGINFMDQLRKQLGM